MTQQVHRFPEPHSLTLTMTLGYVSSGLWSGAQVHVFEDYSVPSSLVLPCSQAVMCLLLDCPACCFHTSLLLIVEERGSEKIYLGVCRTNETVKKSCF